MTREEIKRAITEYFEENEELFIDCIEELDAYNGYLGDDRCYPMADLDEFYHGVEASEILARAFYGHDEYGDEFNPNRNYFYFNGYGNLVSTDEPDYSGFLDDYAIEAMSENRSNIYSIGEDAELSALFDALDECEE